MKDGMARLRFMIGEWDVEAHVMDGEGEWFPAEQPKETSISILLDGACHREEMPVSVDGQTTRYFFSWSYDTYRNVYRMISCDSCTGLMSVLEGNFEKDTDTVVITDLHSGTAVVDEHGQLVFARCLASTKTSADSFTDIVFESYDQGQTWHPVFRAVHNRKGAKPQQQPPAIFILPNNP